MTFWTFSWQNHNTSGYNNIHFNFDETDHLLRYWDVPELIPIFKAKKVTKDVFHLLTNDDINHLIPENGISKIKFRAKLMEYRLQCGYPMTIESTAYTNNSAQPKVIVSRPGYTFIWNRGDWSRSVKEYSKYQLISIIVFFVFVFTIFGCFYFFLIKPSMEEHAKFTNDFNQRQAKFTDDFNKRRDEIWSG